MQGSGARVGAWRLLDSDHAVRGDNQRGVDKTRKEEIGNRK